MQGKIWTYVPLYGVVIDTQFFDFDAITINPIIDRYGDLLVILVLTHYPEFQFVYYYNLQKKEISNATYEENCEAFVQDTNTHAKIIIGDVFHVVLSIGMYLILDLNRTVLSWEKGNANLPEAFYSNSVHKNNTVIAFGGWTLQSGSSLLSNSLISINFSKSTIQFDTISENYLSPSPRHSHTLKLIRGIFYLFGGKNADAFLGDFWKYDPFTDHWEMINSIGNSPSARNLFGASVQGDALLIFGGEDSTALNNDMYMYNILTNTWTEISGTTGDMPSKRKAACVVLNLPYAYIFGGIDSAGICKDLWRYNFGNNTYQFVSSSVPVAYAHCMVEENSFFYLGGSTISDVPYRKKVRYDLTTGKWETSEVDLPNFTENIFADIGKNFIFFGGREKNIRVTNQFTLYQDSGLIDMASFEDYPYSMSYVYYNRSIYYHGGRCIFSPFALSLSQPLSYFSRIDLIEIFKDADVQCSKGTYLANGSCELCPVGTYAEGLGNSKCLQCEAGFYNPMSGASIRRQCYPCPEGTFNSKAGASQCKTCPVLSYCPAGSKFPINSFTTFTKDNSVQPDLYSPSYPALYLLLLRYLGAFFVFTAVAIVILVPRFKQQIIKLDLFDSYHNHQEGEFVVVRKNFIGGIFSIAFYGATIIVIGSVMSLYFLDNIGETKTLIPLVILQKDVSKFEADFEITVELEKYGDKCQKELGMDLPSCSEFIYLNTRNIEIGSDSIECVLDSDKTCKIVYKCVQCSIGIGAYLEILLEEDLSFATSISINVTSDSSIPGSRSSVSLISIPDPGLIFIGPIANEFYLSMTPSYFTSSINSFPSDITGYHVSALNTPQLGSQNLIENLSIVTQLNVKVNLEKDLVGLYTTRFALQSSILLASGLFGTITGMAGIVAMIMAKVEGLVRKREKKKKKRDNVEKVLELGESIREFSFKDTNGEFKDIDTRVMDSKAMIEAGGSQFESMGFANFMSSERTQCVKVNNWME